MSFSDRPSGDLYGRLNASRTLTWWFGLMSLAGLLRGSLAEQRPFGADVRVHPLVVFGATVGIGLLIPRVLTQSASPRSRSEPGSDAHLGALR